MSWKLSKLPQRSYCWLYGQAADFKEDQRGLSGVVVTVLLILVAVIAVVLIWGFLGDWLAELWERVTGEAARIE